MSQWNSGDYQLAGLDGTNWLSWTDDRFTGAWVADGEFGFMWTSNAGGQRPNPYVKVARITEDSMTQIDEPEIWSQNATFTYPEACPNNRGRPIGITPFYSASNPLQNHVIGVRDDYSNVQWSRRWDQRAEGRQVGRLPIMPATLA